MTDIHPTGSPIKEIPAGMGNPPSDFCWGAAEIGAVIGRTRRQTHHMLATGAIECAKKKAGRWVASRRALLAEFGG